MNREIIRYLIKNITIKIRWLAAVLLTVTGLGVDAETNTSHNFGPYTVHYSVFNSTMIQPEIANAHKLKRANNLAYINIAVVENNDNNASNYGIAVKITGQARNLLQQQQQLQFIAIEEQNATYYLSSLYHNNEDIYHFDITIVTDEQTPAETFTFTKTLYVE